jgi:hypothetical protein
MVTATETAALPPELGELDRQLVEGAREVEALDRELTDAQFAWRPHAAAWNVGQCLQHMAEANRLYCQAMAASVEEARRRGQQRRAPIAPGWLARRFLAELEPPPRRRLPAPGKLVPAPDPERQLAVAEFRRQHEAVRQLLVAAAPFDLNRARFQNPFLPLVRFTVGAGFLIVAAHQRRHLWQIARLRARPAFPARAA